MGNLLVMRSYVWLGSVISVRQSYSQKVQKVSLNGVLFLLSLANDKEVLGVLSRGFFVFAIIESPWGHIRGECEPYCGISACCIR